MGKINRVKNILTLSLFLIGFNISAQEITSLTDFRNYESKDELVKFNRLLFDNIPTIYIQNGKSIAKEESPERIITDVDSWNKLNQVENSKEIRVIILRIHDESDLTTRLDLKLLKRFSSLEKVFISGDFSICNDSTEDCEVKKISSILNGSENIEIIYNFQTIN